MAYKILIDKSGTPKLVEVPEKPTFSEIDSFLESSQKELFCYEQALSAALADEIKHIPFKDEVEVTRLIWDTDETYLKMLPDHISAVTFHWRLNHIGQSFDLPENISVSFEECTIPCSQVCIDEGKCGQPCAILKPIKCENSAHSFTEGMEMSKPEVVPSCGEPEDTFYKWILTEIVEFERLKSDKKLPMESRNAYDLAFIQMKKVRQMYNDRNLAPTKH